MFHIDKQFLPEIAIYSRYISVLSYNIQTYIFITILKYLPFKNKKMLAHMKKLENGSYGRSITGKICDNYKNIYLHFTVRNNLPIVRLINNGSCARVGRRFLCFCAGA